MNNGKIVIKQEILFISFRFSCRQGPCLSTLLPEGRRIKKGRAGHLFNNKPRPVVSAIQPCALLSCCPLFTN